MSGAIDLKLTRNDLGIYDIGLGTNGDLETTDGLDTAILMSILCEKRADGSEITSPRFRRGDWSNELNDVEGYEVGSKFWLLEKARADQESLNKGIEYITDGLQWMVEDSIIKEVNVTGALSFRQITFYVTITKQDNKIDTYLFEAFESTPG